MPKPIEDQICDVMADYRFRRLKYKVDHPETLLKDDGMGFPQELTRHAEAMAIAMLFPRSEQAPQPLSE